MMATRSRSVRLVTLCGAVALATAGLVGPVAVIGAVHAGAAGTIFQAAPTAGSVNLGTAFSGQLETTGNNGPVTFATDSATTWGSVSSTGAVSAPATTPIGNYFLFGTDSDAFGDTGVWRYTLTVHTHSITQTAPTAGSVTTTGSATFTDQLETTGNIGPVTFTKTGGGTGLDVSSSGQITTTGTLAAGSYTATGSMGDASAGAGNFTYTLTVSPVIISQIAPTSGSVSTGGSATFTDQLETTGNNGPATFTGGGTGLDVSSGGQITTTGTLAAGTYTATGTTGDAYGDTGTFTYTLTVGAIIQTTPTSGSVTVSGSAAFTDQLNTTGNNGPVTFTGGGTGLEVSSSGQITTTGTLAAGTYTATGTMGDALGDTGTFTYTLTVGAIIQTTPTSGSVTVSGSAAFTDQLNTTGSDGPVTFAGSGTGLEVSSSGQITTTGTLAAGTYTATGTTGDASGDVGNFTYTLTVSPVTISQTTPMSGSVTTTESSAFTDQLETTGSNGPVTFTGSGAGLSVSSGGQITTTGTLAAGPHTATGTTADAFGDTGTFTYTLTVSPVTISQTDPTSGSVTTTESSVFSDQLETTGSNGPVTFTGSGAGLSVSSGGQITTTGTLAAGPHTVTGTTGDAFGDTGSFTYTLTVSPVIIYQTKPTSGLVTTTESSTFTDQLETTGTYEPVTFSGSGAGLSVSSAGQITTTGTLAAGTYTASGTTGDAYGDTGTFSYTLTVSSVSIIQNAPMSGSVTTTGSAAFIDHLQTTGNVGAASFTGGGVGLTVSSSGQITTTGTLAAGIYTATGTTGDAYGDSGDFTYTLTVSPVTISQTAPMSGSVTVGGSSAFTDQLETNAPNGPVTFTGGGTGLNVSSSGQITTTGTLAAGTYTATGTTGDAYEDTGTFNYTLTVGSITQTAPTSGSVTTTGSAGFTDQLVTTGNNGPVTFTGGGTGLAVSSSGQITTTGTLAAGTYTATGTTGDASGDVGTFTYTLTVSPVTISQIDPTSNSVSGSGSTAFTDQLETTGNNGPVTFTKTGGSTGLDVSPSGQITTTGTLAIGTYTAKGTTEDAYGDAGTFSYTLIVVTGLISQTSPPTGSVETTGSANFTTQLHTSGNEGPVTFTKTSGGTALSVSSSGQITTTGTLAVGTYTATGTTGDAFGNGGTFTYTLTVSPATISQTTPTTGSVTTTGSAGFTAQLHTTVPNGPVTFTGGGAGLDVSTGGKVTTSGTLAAGTYTAIGSTGDALGDVGSFTYTLTVRTVPITQTTPTSGSVMTSGSSAFTTRLDTTGNIGPVTFTGGGAGLDVSSTGTITTSGTLALGTYTATGTTGDAYGDTGTFTYTLTVSAVPITLPFTGAPGYTMVASDGGIFSYGGATFYGSTGGTPLNKPIVGMATTTDGKGYWMVASDGGIFNYGDAAFYGSAGATPLNKPIVGMAATHDGKGYWMVASDGGIFSYGDATFYGSAGGTPLNKPIVGMAATPDGKGYWLVASDGGIFSYGDATFYGSTGGTPLNKPIVGMTANPNGKGYWLVASDGGIFSYGDATFYGSTGGTPLNKPIVGMAATPDGNGYWMVASDGGIFSYGDATFYGSTGGTPLNKPIVGMAMG